MSPIVGRTRISGKQMRSIRQRRIHSISKRGIQTQKCPHGVGGGRRDELGLAPEREEPRVPRLEREVGEEVAVGVVDVDGRERDRVVVAADRVGLDDRAAHALEQEPPRVDDPAQRLRELRDRLALDLLLVDAAQRASRLACSRSSGRSSGATDRRPVVARTSRRVSRPVATMRPLRSRVNGPSRSADRPRRWIRRGRTPRRRSGLSDRTMGRRLARRWGLNTTSKTWHGGPAVSRLVVGLAVCALLGSVLAACSSGSSGPPTVNFYIYPDNSGAVQQAVDNCTSQSHGQYVIKYQKLPTGADGQREQMVRRLAAHDSVMDILGPRRDLGARVRGRRLDPGVDRRRQGRGRAGHARPARWRRRPTRASSGPRRSTATPSCSGTGPTSCPTRRRRGTR